MKIKSMIAALAASAIAVSALAVSASAEVLKKVGNEKNAEIYMVPVDGLDLSKLDKIVAEVSCDSTKMNGGIGYNNADGNWTQHEFNSEIESGVIEQTWEKDGLAGTVKDGLQVQLWWVEPKKDADGNESDGTAQLNSVKLLDKDGNELTKTETQATTTTTEKSGASVTTTTTAKETKKTDSAKTGDAGVGVAVAALGLASAAAFVARKKD